MGKVGQVIGLLKRNWKQMLEFEGLYKALSFFVFTPLFFQMFNFSMKLTGYTYLTSENIREYFLNPVTVVMLVVILLCMTLYSLVDISAVIFIMDQSYQRRQTTLLQIGKTAVKNSLRLFSGGNWRLALLVLFMIPFLNIGITSSYVSSISIPEFIQKYILGHWYLTVLIGLGFFAVLFFIVRWMYSFHYYTLEKCDFKSACAKSRNLNKGKKLLDFLSLVFIQFVFVLLYLALLALFILAAVCIERLASDHSVVYAVLMPAAYVAGGFLMVVLMLFTVPLSYAGITILFYMRKAQLNEPVIHMEPEKVQKRKPEKKKKHLLEGIMLAVALVGAGSYIYQDAQGRNNLNVEYLKTMEVTAHRGASEEYPENTMLAFERAVEQDADWIELDVQQTSDGQIIVMHDTNLKRTTGLNRNIWETDYAQIQTLEAGSFKSSEFAGEPVPLLSEVIEFARLHGVRLNIELKPTGHETDFEKSVVDLINEYDFEDFCVVTSQQYQVLKNVKDYDERVFTVYVMSVAYGNVLDLDAADAFSIEADFVSEKLVKKIHNDGKQIYAWTVNTEGGINRMIGLNVDNIITDDVTLARKCIYEKKNSSYLIDYVRTLLNM